MLSRASPPNVSQPVVGEDRRSSGFSCIPDTLTGQGEQSFSSVSQVAGAGRAGSRVPQFSFSSCCGQGTGRVQGLGGAATLLHHDLVALAWAGRHRRCTTTETGRGRGSRSAGRRYHRLVDVVHNRKPVRRDVVSSRISSTRSSRSCRSTASTKANSSSIGGSRWNTGAHDRDRCCVAPDTSRVQPLYSSHRMPARPARSRFVLTRRTSAAWCRARRPQKQRDQALILRRHHHPLREDRFTQNMPATRHCLGWPRAAATDTQDGTVFPAPDGEQIGG